MTTQATSLTFDLDVTCNNNTPMSQDLQHGGKTMTLTLHLSVLWYPLQLCWIGMMNYANVVRKENSECGWISVFVSHTHDLSKKTSINTPDFRRFGHHCKISNLWRIIMTYIMIISRWLSGKSWMTERQDVVDLFYNKSTTNRSNGVWTLVRKQRIYTVPTKTWAYLTTSMPGRPMQWGKNRSTCLQMSAS